MEDRGKRILVAGLPLLALVLACVIAYSSSLPNGFTNWDDNWLITENPWIREISFETLSTILDPTVEAKVRFQLGAEYLPVRDFSYMLDYAIFGLSATGYHVTNLLLHTLVVLLLYLLVLRLSGNVLLAFSTGFLFAVHPLHVESVAWLSSRKDLLAGTFYLLALLAWNAFRRAGGMRKGFPFWMASLVCFILACTSKYMAVTLPAALLLHDWLLFRPRPTRGKPRILLPLLQILPFFLFMLFFAKVVVVRIASRGLIRGWYGDGFADTFRTVCNVMREYIFAIFVPAKLQACVDYPITRSLDLPTVLSALLIVGLAGFGVAVLVRALFAEKEPSPSLRLAAFSILFFFASISPVSNILFPMGTLYAERYLYLPLVGGPLLLGGLFTAGLGRALRTTSPKVAALRTGAAILGLLVIGAAYGVKTFAYNGVWKDSETLWRDVIAKGGESHHTAHFNLGIDATERAGRAGPSGAVPILEEAEGHLRRALETRHESYFYDYARVHAALGTVLDLRGLHEEAVQAFDRAMQINEGNIESAPSDQTRDGERIARAEILVNRGNSLTRLGKPENLRAAEEDFREAIALHPDSPLAHLNLGLLLAKETGQTTRKGENPGVAFLEKAMLLDPYLAEAPLNLGILAFNAGKTSKARVFFLRALERRPGLPDGHFYLAAIHLEQEEYAQAREAYARILSAPKITPEWRIKALTHQALTFTMERKYTEAEKAYKKILADFGEYPPALLDPVRAGLVDLYGSFAGARLAQENYGEACAWFEKALRIDPENPDAVIGLVQACTQFGSELAMRGVEQDTRGNRRAALLFYRQAISAFRRAAELRSSYNVWLAIGETAKKAGDLDLVLEAFAKALEHLDVKRLREERMKIFLAQAQAFLNAQETASAVEACRKGAEAYPEGIEPYRILVHIYEKRAKAHGERAETARREGGEANRNRAKWEKEAQKKALRQALEAVQAILERKPTSAPDLSQQGRILAQLGRREEAVEAFRKLIEKEPKVAEHYVNLAILLEKMGKGEEGLSVLRKAMSLNPDSTRAREALLRTLKREGLRALSVWRNQIREGDRIDDLKDPEGFWRVFDQARAWAIKAETDFREYLTHLGPGEKDPLIEKILRQATADRLFFEGRRRIEKEDFEGAEARFREALDHVKTHTGALYSLAKVLEKRGAFEEAWKTVQLYIAVEKSAQATPSFRKWRDYLARQVAQRRYEAGVKKAGEGDRTGALASLEGAIRAHPDFPLYHIGRGRILALLERRGEALKSFREALRLLEAAGLGTGSLAEARRAFWSDASRGLAELEGKEGRWAEAAAALEKAARVVPGDAFLQLDLGQAWEKAGKGEAARKGFTRALELFRGMQPSDDLLLARKAFGIKQAEEGLQRLKKNPR
ncbi:MAG: tetratricopeptide repeat protein [Planctomycetota bacterium]|jgi:tetratricopeptide (TPR) repeat protein